MSLGGFDGVELVVADFREVGATLFYCNKCGGHCKVYYNPRKGLEEWTVTMKTHLHVQLITDFRRVYSIAPILKCLACDKYVRMNHSEVLARLAPTALMHYPTSQSELLHKGTQLSTKFADVLEDLQMCPASVDAFQRALTVSNNLGRDRAVLMYLVERARALGLVPLRGQPCQMRGRGRKEGEGEDAGDEGEAPSSEGAEGEGSSSSGDESASGSDC
uniref:Uncharacterized protein n=2 Tax=Emiliania huxleyi TaxID=2903 RepID=A0A7S3TC72_EMIHU|mmetsp:Transcript_20535/g.61147  ORF Transcript_20535/g.61147 Transcript_20535/m.61147 type:complete len:218 (+) Transcript_20535:870-1523(+)